jgi:cytidylate kinase
VAPGIRNTKPMAVGPGHPGFFKGDKKMAVITITGLLGTGEDQLALSVAEKTGYQYIDRSIIEDVLKEYGIVDSKEVLDKPLHFLDTMGKEKRDTADLLNKMYLIFAKQNNVVLHSRRASLVLEPFVNVMNVLLKAPRIARIQYLIANESMEEQQAVKRIDQEELTRKKIIESFYKKEWDSFFPWALVLDTHKLGLEYCENVILESCTRIKTFDEAFGWQDGFPSVDTIEVDPILEKTINKVLFDRKTSAPAKGD